jgi:hypothetical protein
MTPTAPAATAVPLGLDTSVFRRVLQEGYGTGAWHGPDLAAAVSDVGHETAFRRVAPGRHNIAEIAVHHAWFIRSVTAQLTGRTPDAFALDGEEWFEVNAGTGPNWEEVRAILAGYQDDLVEAVADIGAGRIASPLAESERFGLVLGITCHAVYHAGQIQLLKRLLAG